MREANKQRKFNEKIVYSKRKVKDDFRQHSETKQTEVAVVVVYFLFLYFFFRLYYLNDDKMMMMMIMIKMMMTFVKSRFYFHIVNKKKKKEVKFYISSNIENKNNIFIAKL